jgi:hypothetical protein
LEGIPLKPLDPVCLCLAQIHVVTTREYLRRRNETFARVRPSQLQELFIEYEEEVEEDIGGELSGPSRLLLRSEADGTVPPALPCPAPRHEAGLRWPAGRDA